MESSDDSNPVNTVTTVASNSSTNALRQQDFLRLMVAQVQNQDFLAQLAQFSTNDGINNMETSINQLASSLQSNQALQASALVGRKVLVNNNHLILGSNGHSIIVAVNIASDLSNLNASIYSSLGDLIKTIPISQSAAGIADFIWDGTNNSNEKMAAGNYTVKVTGNYNGQTVPVPTMTYANVDSVSLNSSGFQLNVSGVGAVSLNDVKQISM